MTDIEHLRKLVHKARPVNPDAEPGSWEHEHCFCGWRIHAVPGGQGMTYVHTHTGTVAGPGNSAPEHVATRGSDVEAWIKEWRNDFEHRGSDAVLMVWETLDAMLDDYREHADTGTPLCRAVPRD